MTETELDQQWISKGSIMAAGCRIRDEWMKWKDQGEMTHT